MDEEVNFAKGRPRAVTEVERISEAADEYKLAIGSPVTTDKALKRFKAGIWGRG